MIVILGCVMCIEFVIYVTSLAADPVTYINIFCTKIFSCSEQYNYWAQLIQCLLVSYILAAIHDDLKLYKVCHKPVTGE